MGLVAQAVETACGPAIEEAVAQPFDLEREPLFRAQLFHQSPEDHTLLLMFDHTVIDAGSMDPSYAELCEIYATTRAGRPPRLPKSGIQFAEFARWQLDGLERGDYASHVEGEMQQRFAAAEAGA